MPDPRPGESHDDYLDRCVPMVTEDGTAESPEQAVAVCESMWERSRRRGATRRHLRALVETAEIRTATYNGSEHLVVPVVMLVGDSVVKPMNADGPELVPAAELAAAPGGWNGRPVLPDHPENGRATANEPRTLERWSFGQVFHARFEDGRLKAEAWLNPDRAEQISPAAGRACRQVREGEMVEVSVGAWVTTERRAGTKDGQDYVAVWRDIVPDHLAIGLDGAQGACSVEMGCGAPRLNRENRQEEPTMESNSKLEVRLTAAPIMRRVLAALGFRNAQEPEGVSDSELREALWMELRSVEPAFEGVAEVFPADGLVVYAVAPDGELEFYRRAFALEDDGSIELTGDRELVEPVTRYESVAASTDDHTLGDAPPVPEAKAGTNAEADPPRTAAGSCACTDEGDPMTDRMKSLVERLIACEHSPFDEDDAEGLAGFSEDRLAALADHFAGLSVKPETPEPPAPMTDDEWMAAAPESLRAMCARYQREEQERRVSLVEAIGKATDSWTAEQLGDKSTEELTAIAKALKLDRPAPNFSDRPQVVEGDDQDLVRFAPPDTYGLNRKTKEAN